MASSVGLTWSDFGMWSIWDQLAAPLPINSIITYSAFAGGTQLTTAMPASGTATYSGAMTGVLAYTVVGGSDDVSGSASLNVDFGAGTISGTISGISTAVGATTTTISGKFYGPAANEITGTFTISEATPGVAHILIGSFGAKP